MRIAAPPVILIVMQFWLLLAVTLILQESVSTNIVLISAYQQHYPLLIIHGIYIVASFVDIYIGYLLGKWAHKHSHGGKPGSLTNRIAKGFERILGEHGTKLSMVLLGFFNFAYLNSFIFAWLGFPAEDIFVYVFLGNVLWYASEWLVVVGASAIAPDPLSAIGLVLGVAVLVVIVMRLAGRRFGPRRF